MNKYEVKLRLPDDGWDNYTYYGTHITTDNESQLIRIWGDDDALVAFFPLYNLITCKVTPVTIVGDTVTQPRD